MTTPATPTVLPLHGTRVLDLTHVWSGPMGTRLLTALGAETIKVENPAKPDLLRGLGGDLLLRYPDLDPGIDPQNRNAWFNTQNTGKRGVTIDLKDPEGLALARRIAAGCDAVVANYRSGVLDRIGLGYSALTELRPDIVVVEMPGYPADSPHANAPAFGAQFDAHSGSAVLSGDDNVPLLTGFALGDPTAGLFAAAATITALLRRNSTGQGAHVILPQSESMIPLLGEYLYAASHGEAVAGNLNADRRFIPNGLYRTRAGWLAVTARDDGQWTRLARRLEVTSPGISARYPTLARRREHRDEIECAVRDWASGLDDPVAAASELQADGVPAGPSNDAGGVSRDPQLGNAGYFTELRHPSAGTHRYPNLPVTVNGVRAAPRAPAPRLGADTDWCLRHVLGLTETEIATLHTRGVVTGPHGTDTDTAAPAAQEAHP